MRERADCVPFFSGLLESFDLPEVKKEIYFDKQYAFVGDLEDEFLKFLGLVLISDPLRLEQPVLYSYAKNLVLSNESPDMQLSTVLPYFRGGKAVFSMDKEFILSEIELTYNSFAKRKKGIIFFDGVHGGVSYHCMPIKKRSQLDCLDGTFAADKAQTDDPADVCFAVNLQSFFSVLLEGFADCSRIIASVSNQGAIFSCSSDMRKFYIPFAGSEKLPEAVKDSLGISD